MMTKHGQNLLLTLAAFCAGGLIALPLAAQAPATAPETSWADFPEFAPGAQISVIEGQLDQAGPLRFRLRLPPDSKIPPYTRPTEDRVTVISGYYFVGQNRRFYDASRIKKLGPGSVAAIQPNVPVYGYTTQEAIVQLEGMGPWRMNYVTLDSPRK